MMQVLLIGALLLTACSPATGQSKSAATSSRVVRYALPTGLELHDWSWSGSTIVASDQSHDISVLEITDRQVRQNVAHRNVSGKFPVLLSDDTYAYVDDANRIVVASLANGHVVRKTESGVEGLIGELTNQAGSLWFYTIDQHSDPSFPKSYRVDWQTMKAVRVVDGYCPRVLGSELFYVAKQDEFALFASPFDGNSCDTKNAREVTGGGVFAPQQIPGNDRLVCQRGFDRPSIDLIRTNGEVIRCLSGKDRSARWPLVSPSGKFVAFTIDADKQAAVVEVANLKGRLIHQSLIGSHPINAAYRWSIKSDRLAVLVPTGERRGVLEIITLTSEE